MIDQETLWSLYILASALFGVVIECCTFEGNCSLTQRVKLAIFFAVAWPIVSLWWLTLVGIEAARGKDDDDHPEDD